MTQLGPMPRPRQINKLAAVSEAPRVSGGFTLIKQGRTLTEGNDAKRPFLVYHRRRPATTMQSKQTWFGSSNCTIYPLWRQLCNNLDGTCGCLRPLAYCRVPLHHHLHGPRAKRNMCPCMHGQQANLPKTCWNVLPRWCNSNHRERPCLPVRTISIPVFRHLRLRPFPWNQIRSVKHLWLL